MAVIELPCGMLMGLSIRYRQVPLWMGPFWTFLVESPPDLVETEYGCMICAKQAFRVPSNLAQPEIGCMIYDKQAFRVPPDSAQPEIGCMIYDKQAFRVPSNLAQPEIGCMICARQAFRVPSDSAQTEDGCRKYQTSFFACHPIWRQAKKDGKNARNVPEKRTGKL